MMTIAEIKAAINFGRETIKEYKKLGKETPAFVYDRTIDLYNELVKKLDMAIELHKELAEMLMDNEEA